MARPPLNTEDPQQPYAQLAGIIRDAIEVGDYQVGDKLPSIRELAVSHAMAKSTVQRALALLQDDGILTAWAGRGTYVRRKPSDPQPTAESDAIEQINARLDSIMDILGKLDQRITEGEKSRRRQGRSAHSGDG